MAQRFREIIEVIHLEYQLIKSNVLFGYVRGKIAPFSMDGDDGFDVDSGTTFGGQNKEKWTKWQWRENIVAASTVSCFSGRKLLAVGYVSHFSSMIYWIYLIELLEFSISLFPITIWLIAFHPHLNEII